MAFEVMELGKDWTLCTTNIAFAETGDFSFAWKKGKRIKLAVEPEECLEILFSYPVFFCMEQFPKSDAVLCNSPATNRPFLKMTRGSF